LEKVVIENAPDLPPALDPTKDLKIKDFDFMEMYIKRNQILQQMAQSKCHDCPLRSQQVKVKIKNSKKSKEREKNLEM
jgi:hypothetical protein